MKNIFKKIVAKETGSRPELTKVYINKNSLVATDSYSLIKIEKAILKDGDKLTVDLLDKRFENSPIMLKPEELDLEPKIIDIMPVEEAVNYPDYRIVIPKDKDLETGYTMITLDPNKLVNLLQSIIATYGSGKKYATIKLYVPKDSTKPVVVKRGKDEGALGLLMAMNKQD